MANIHQLFEMIIYECAVYRSFQDLQVAETSINPAAKFRLGHKYHNHLGIQKTFQKSLLSCIRLEFSLTSLEIFYFAVLKPI